MRAGCDALLVGAESGVDVEDVVGGVSPDTRLGDESGRSGDF